MRKANDKSLKEAIAQMMQVYKLKRKFDETSIVTLWPELMGTSVGNRTKEVFIRNKKLFLKIESSVVKNELLIMRSQIIERINEKAGSELVTEIIFL